MTMNRNIVLSTLTGLFSLSAVLLTACSEKGGINPDNNEIKELMDNIEFKIDFADYNSEQEFDMTRGANKEMKLEEKAINIGHGIIAQASLCRDTTKQENQITRALPNDDYTMVAYDAVTHEFKGEMSGRVVSGYLLYSHRDNRMILEPGKPYDLILFNSKITRNGNRLVVNRVDAENAMMDRIQHTFTATPNRQQVKFNLKHVGAKVSIKLITYMGLSSGNSGRPKLESINDTDVPGSSIYDISTGTWSAGAGETMSTAISYENNINVVPGSDGRQFYKISKTAAYLISGTEVSKLKLTFINGFLYGLNLGNLNPKLSFTFTNGAGLKLEPNGAYILSVKFMWRFPYLMSDGSIGSVEETIYGGGTKIPVAAVLSRSKHMGVALKDAGGGQRLRFCDLKYRYNVTNTHFVNRYEGRNRALSDKATSGKSETWDPSYTTAVVTGDKVKGRNPDFPAFKAAAEYNPGVTYTGHPALIWYLPSASDWKWFLTGLSGTDPSFHSSIWNFGSAYHNSGYLVRAIFTQVEGDLTIDNDTNPKYLQYISSTEFGNDQGYIDIGYVHPMVGLMGFYPTLKVNPYLVRAFVEF